MSLQTHYKHAQRELELIGTLAQEAVLKHDYATIEFFISEWGEKHEEVYELEAISANNFTIAKYSKDVPSKFLLQVQHKVTLEGNNILHLKIVKDLSPVEKEFRSLKIKFTISAIFFIAILGFILWKTLKITAMLPLEMEITERRLAEQKLDDAYKELKATQSQILQQEKMASIGQLAAGVAHEINNPMGFISSNLGTLNKYVKKLTEFISAQTSALESITDAEVATNLQTMRKKMKIDYIIKDADELIEESLDGAERVKIIVQNLKTFSRVDDLESKPVDLNQCIESTLNIVWNEIKYNATVEKEYGKLPLTKCYPQQMNQVFLNLLVNASQALDKQGVIKIKTWNSDEKIHISISDTGNGIPAEKITRIFEPFFTTKEVGKGTGLGLSISYDIVKKHNGDILVESAPGQGTTFTVIIPIVEEGNFG